MLLLLTLSFLSRSMPGTCPLSRTDRCCGFSVNCRGPSRTWRDGLQLRQRPCRAVFSNWSRKPRLRSDWTNSWAQFIFWDILCLWIFWPDSIFHDSGSLGLPILKVHVIWTSLVLDQEAAVWLFFLPCFWFSVCVWENMYVQMWLHVQMFSF